MLKYYDYAVCFQEFPNEISLCVNISGCPCRCLGCHSKYLWNDVGKELDEEAIDLLIRSHPDCTLFGIMGGDNDHEAVKEIIDFIKTKFPRLRVGMYSGLDEVDSSLLGRLDYYKVGRYDTSRGGLKQKTTNQRMYDKNGTDVTDWFWSIDKL